MPSAAKKSPKIQEIIVFGLRIAYSDSGDAKPSAGGSGSNKSSNPKADAPVLLFLHDWCSNRSSFSEQVAAFSGAYRCIAVDLPGHGRSSKPSLEYSIILMAEIMTGFLKALNVEKASVIGHGYGACIALEMTQQAKDVIGSLVLVNPASLFSSEDAKTEQAKAQDQVESVGFKSYFSNTINENYFDRTDPEHFRDWALKSLARLPEEVGKSILDTRLDWPGKSVLRANKDRDISLIFSAPPAQSPEHLSEHIPHLKWGKTVNPSYYGHLTAPEETNALLRSALTLSC